MSVFQSPFNLSYGQWNNGPDTANGGGMSYSWGRVQQNTALYNAVQASGPMIAAITVINGRLARYYASSDSTDVTKSGHSFYSTFQTRGISVDEAIASNSGPGEDGYYSNGIREATFGPATGNDNSRIMLYGLAP